MSKWSAVIKRALQVESTPMFVFSWPLVCEAVQELDDAAGAVSGLPVRHWLSLKTQPLRALVRHWQRTGQGVEVVSEFEYRAARTEGLDVDEVLVNGVAKHGWLGRHSERGLRVQFDSLLEIDHLREIAARDSWRVGLRVHLPQERDPDDRDYATQFGLDPQDCGTACNRLKDVGVHVEGLHFHLQSNVEQPEIFGDAIRELQGLCRQIGLRPRYIDCGGGVPAPGERPSGGEERSFDLRKFFATVQDACGGLPSVEEVWLENGRFLTSRAGVLVVTVVDRKEREGVRYLVCDGGRTNHALVSDWEEHRVEVYPKREGADTCMSTVCGPTCMAYDHLCRRELPSDVKVGDQLLWHNAGAYHLPWETRFSHGLAPIVWYGSDDEVTLVRERERFESWWTGLGGRCLNEMEAV